MSIFSIIALLVGVALVILQLFDLHSTKKFLSVGVKEGNPIFGPTFNKVPFWVAVILKPSVAFIYTAAIYLLRDKPEMALLLALPGAFVCEMYYRTVRGNYHAYKRAKARLAAADGGDGAF